MRGRSSSNVFPRASARAAGAPGAHALEALEQRSLLTSVFSAQEVYFLELVNRARANPQAEAQRLNMNLSAGLTLTEASRIGPQEPLALSPVLSAAARAHSQDMADRSFIDHFNPDGLSPTQRVRAAGYTGTAGENIGAGYATIDDLYRGWMLGPEQRKNILSLHSTFDSTFHYDQIGPGFMLGLSGKQYANYFTADFGNPTGSRPAYLLGVVYTDSNSNSFYSIGEGLGGVKIDVFTGNSTAGAPVATFTTDSAGNYQLPLGAGTYSVRFTHLATGKLTVKSATISSANVKLDATAGDLRLPPPEDDHPNAGAYAFATPITINATTADGSKAGVLGESGDTDLFTFAAARSGTTTITAGWGGGAGTLLLRVRVYNSAFSLIGTGAASGRDSSVTLSLAAQGTYYVVVDSTGLATGEPSPTSYTLSIDGPPDVPPPPPPPTDDHANWGQWGQATVVPIDGSTSAGSRSGTLGATDDQDLFRVSVPVAGQATITVRFGAGALLLRLRVYSPEVSFLIGGTPNGRDTVATINLQGATTYYLLVDSDGSTGSGTTPTTYTLFVQGAVAGLDPDPDPTPVDDHADAAEWTAAAPIAVDSTSLFGSRSGALETLGDADLFTFTAPRSGVTTLTLRHGAGSQGLLFRVYNAAQSFIGGGTASGLDSSVALTLAAGQKYYVLVSSPFLVDSGAVSTSYDVSIQGPNVPPPPPPLPDSVLSGEDLRLATTLAQGKTRAVFFNASNQLIFAQRAPDGAWTATTLSAIPGLPGLTGTPVTWTEPKDQLTYVATGSPKGLIVLRQAPNGSWSFRNISKQTPGSARMISSPALVIDRTNTVHLAGLAPDGDLVLYSQNGRTFPNGGFRYDFRNITEVDVKPVGKTMPVLTGAIVGSVNGPGAVQFAALDTLGRVFFFNRPATLTTWAMNNLTRVTGAARITGSLSIVQTASNTTSIAGVTASGELWSYSRRAGAAWRAANVSALDPAAPTLSSGLSAYVNGAGAGFFASVTTTGDVLLYRVRFIGGAFEWTSAGVSSAIAQPPRIVGPVRAVLAAGTINIIGADAQGHLHRFVFSPATQLWAIEDVSELLAAA